MYSRRYAKHGRLRQCKLRIYAGVFRFVFRTCPCNASGGRPCLRRLPPHVRPSTPFRAIERARTYDYLRNNRNDAPAEIYIVQQVRRSRISNRITPTPVYGVRILITLRPPLHSAQTFTSGRHLACVGPPVRVLLLSRGFFACSTDNK